MPFNLLFVKAFPLVLYRVIVFKVHVGLGKLDVFEHFHHLGGNDDAHATVEPFGVDADEAEVDDIRLFQGFQHHDLRHVLQARDGQRDAANQEAGVFNPAGSVLAGAHIHLVYVRADACPLVHNCPPVCHQRSSNRISLIAADVKTLQSEHGRETEQIPILVRLNLKSVGKRVGKRIVPANL